MLTNGAATISKFSSFLITTKGYGTYVKERLKEKDIQAKYILDSYDYYGQQIYYVYTQVPDKYGWSYEYKMVYHPLALEISVPMASSPIYLYND